MTERAFWAQDSTRWGEDPRALLGLRASCRGHLEARLSEVCAPIGQRGCISQAKPSQTECQTEGNRDLYLDNRCQVPNTKPSQTERQTEPLAICIWTFHGAALTSIIILLKRKDAPNQPAPATSNYILEFYRRAASRKKAHDFQKKFWRTAVEAGAGQWTPGRFVL